MSKTKSSVKWLNRSLFESPIHYSLTICPKAFSKEQKRLKIPVERHAVFLSEFADASTHFFDSSTGETCCVVTILPSKNAKRSKEEIYALLVHEAVHVWQAIREIVGEKMPSAEFEAYSIQTISMNLMYSYKQQIKSKHKRTNKCST